MIVIFTVSNMIIRMLLNEINVRKKVIYLGFIYNAI